MLLFLHFASAEEDLLKKAAEELDVLHRCRFEKSLDLLMEIAKGEDPATRNSKFPAVIFLNADADEHIDVLKQIKSHTLLNRLPVVCLGSPKPHDKIVALYEEGANSYIEKPGDYETLVKVAGTALSYWLDTTLLPQQHLRDL